MQIYDPQTGLVINQHQKASLDDFQQTNQRLLKNMAPASIDRQKDLEVQEI